MPPGQPGTTIRFLGGPLDGAERQKTDPARHPTYRNTDGDPIATYLGDRIIGGRSATRACYRMDSDIRHWHGRTVTYRYTTTAREA